MAKLPPANRELIRAINRSAVLNAIKSYGPISRTEVARLTRLSAATVSGITAELIAADLVFEKETGNSRGGRRPIMLALNPLGGYVIGIKLLENQAVGALTDLEATVIAKHTQTIGGHLSGKDPAGEHSPETTIDTLSLVVERLIHDGGIRAGQLLGVGVGLAGIVDAEKGILRYSPILGWSDVPLGALLQDRVHAPVFIGNDVNTLTLTEKWFGAGQEVDNFLTVTIGRGVGLGIVVNGQIYRGHLGGSGEFGHTVIDPFGPLCACGKQGCLEAFVSDPALLRMAAEAVERGDLPGSVQSIDELLSAAEAGDPAARAIYARAGETLGLGVANLINVLSPELIIISGEGIRAERLIVDPMQAAIEAYVMPGLAHMTEIRVDIWNDDAWARGAAGLVLQELFESPMRREGSKSLALRPTREAREQ